ncbi:MAG: hypothetical protein AAB343_02900 [Patescibacteria group bacterium]
MPTRAPLPISRREPVSFTLVMGFIFVVMALILIGGLYGYKQYLIRQRNNARAQIEVFKNDVATPEKKSLLNFADSIDRGVTLLNAHTRVSPVFDILERATTRDVRYTSFAYVPTTRSITLSAVAKTDRAFAEQLVGYRQNPNIEKVEFDNMQLGDDKSISFSVALIVKANALPRIGSQVTPTSNP